MRDRDSDSDRSKVGGLGSVGVQGGEMPRPKSPRKLRFDPDVYYFKPRGVPLRELKEVELARDELEALKIHDVDRLEQAEGARKMGVSQPTFGRILDKAYKKIAEAIVSGKAIKIVR